MIKSKHGRTNIRNPFADVAGSEVLYSNAGYANDEPDFRIRFWDREKLTEEQWDRIFARSYDVTWIEDMDTLPHKCMFKD